MPHLADSFLVEVPGLKQFVELNDGFGFKTEWVWKKAHIGSLEDAYYEPSMSANEMPQFPGGMSELFRYFLQHFHTPSGCFDNKNVTGKIVFSFTIDETGMLKNPEISDYCSNSAANRTIIREVFDKMPRWKPARRNGNPVAVKYSLPMTICFQSQE